MFKKSLIAASIAASVIAGANAASTVTVTEQQVGVEYAQLVGAVTANDVSVTPSIDYENGSVIVLTLSGATFATEDADGDDIEPTVMAAQSGNSTGVIEFLDYSADGSEARFLVTTSITDGGDDDGAYGTFTIGGLTAVTAGAGNGATATISAKAVVDTVVGIVERDESDAEDVMSFATQLGSSVDSGFDAVVDVNAARTAFADGGTVDTLTIANTNVTTLDLEVTPSASTFRVWGDFSFLDADGDGELGGTGDGAVTATGAATVTAADDLSYVDVAYTTFMTGTVGITVNGAGNVLPEQAYMVSADVDYAVGDAEGDVTLLDAASAGAWTLNGANVHVPFMPFSSAFAQLATISNTSNQTGGVDVVFYVGGTTVEVNGIATVAANGVTNISAALQAAARTAGVGSSSVAFDIIVNAPADAIEVTALYYAKADADRLRTK